MRKNKTPSIIVFLILTSITILFWISFSIYRVFTDKPNPDVPINVILPINPTLDNATIIRIKERINPEE